jgi:hypothetical protein
VQGRWGRRRGAVARETGLVGGRRGGAGGGRRARQVGPTCRWLREREGEGSRRMWAGVGQKRATRENLGRSNWAAVGKS